MAPDLSWPLIETRALAKDYLVGGEIVRAVRGVSLTIRRGEFVAIMGASGSGKSTFMNMVGALDAPTAGQMIIDGIDIAELTNDAIALLRNQKIGFVFQQFNLLPRTSAVANVALPLIYAGVGARERRERAAAVLAQLGLAERASHTPARLSGGQQQRVAIARALVTDPLLLLADEPTGALDSATSEDIMTLFQRLNRDGVTIVLVTHDADIARYASRRVLFKDGEVIDDAPVSGDRTVRCGR